MQYRIRCGGFPIERLYVRDAKAGRGTVRRLDNIESSSFGARVIQIDLKAKLANVALHIQVPLLRVSDAVIGIDAIVVRDRARKRRKSILQGQQVSIRIRLRERKWRLICHLQSNGRVCSAVVGDAITGTKNRAVVDPPSDTGARCKVIAIRLDQAPRETSKVGSNLARQHRYDGCEAGGNI